MRHLWMISASIGLFCFGTGAWTIVADSGAWRLLGLFNIALGVGNAVLSYSTLRRARERQRLGDAFVVAATTSSSPHLYMSSYQALSVMRTATTQGTTSLGASTTDFMKVMNQMRLSLGLPPIGPVVELPQRQQQDPFIGYKTTKVIVGGGEVRLQGIRGGFYGVDATAECGLGHDHESPTTACTCGFHALIEPADDWEYGAFRTTVELFGTVIVAERGYRAGRQRVLKVEARKTCAVKSHTSPEPAVGFTCDSDGTVIAVCAEHGILGISTPSEMTAKLGTEVRWAA